MKTYEAASYITISAFAGTLLTNSLLIYLTVFHVKHIIGPYKWMIVIFASTGVLFSFLEAIVRPCVHNFNGGFIFFSLNEYLPKCLLSIGIACYSGFFSSLLAFVTMQFIFRCWTLIGSKLIRHFRGFKVIFWMFFVTFPCAFFGLLISNLIPPDPFSDAYFQEELLQIYELGVKDTPRFIMIPYKSDGIRWKDVAFVIITGISEITNLVIIGYCAFRMRREMNLRLKVMSKRNRRLETQFFKALLAQSAFPTFLLALPTGPVLLLPFMDLKISLQSGFLFSLFSLYPPMDSIAMMMIIKEYRTCGRKVLSNIVNVCFFTSSSGAPESRISSLTASRDVSFISNRVQQSAIGSN